ncbi:MAG: hypothetical protein ABH879_07350 [archaeon]
MGKKVILGGSYNNYGSQREVLNMIEEEAVKEARKSAVTNHYLYRALDDPSSQKFNISVDGIPIIAYAMMNLYKSDAEQVVVVGDAATREIFNHFVKFYDVNNDSERFIFADEGRVWSLENTLRNGKEALGLSDTEPAYFMAGDMIHAWNINPKLSDPDYARYDVVLDLNCLQNIYGPEFDIGGNEIHDGKRGCLYNRRWHLQVGETSEQDDNELTRALWLKEGNDMEGAINDTSIRPVNLMFAARKTHGDSSGHAATGCRSKAVRELYRGKWTELAREAPAVLAYFGVRKAAKFTGWLGYDPNPAWLTLDDLSTALSIAFGLDVMVKAEHADWGFVADIDSAEDLAFNESLMREYGAAVYPYHEEIASFRDYLAGQDIPIVAGNKEHMNQWFGNFPMLRGKEMYNADGSYRHPALFPHAKEKVDKVAQMRTDYLNRQTA